MRFPLFDPNDDGGGGGDDLQAKIAEAVAKETEGLRKNRDDAIAEKKALKGQLSDITAKLDKTSSVIESLGGDEGVESLLVMRKRLEADEVGKLIAEGDIDGARAKIADSMQASHEKALGERDTQIGDLEKNLHSAISELQEERIGNAFRSACGKLEVQDSAVKDVLRAARSEWIHHAEHGLVQKDGDGFALGSDGKSPKTPVEWLEEQRQDSHHWWAPSQGAGAGGNRFGEGGPSQETDLSGLSYQEYVKAREKRGIGSAQQNRFS